MAASPPSYARRGKSWAQKQSFDSHSDDTRGTPSSSRKPTRPRSEQSPSPSSHLADESTPNRLPVEVPDSSSRRGRGRGRGENKARGTQRNLHSTFEAEASHDSVAATPSKGRGRGGRGRGQRQHGEQHGDRHGDGYVPNFMLDRNHSNIPSHLSALATPARPHRGGRGGRGGFATPIKGPQFRDREAGPRSAPSTPVKPRTTSPKKKKKRTMFQEYLPEDKLSEGVASGQYHAAVLRINPFNRQEAYATVPGFDYDVIILGKDQNRSFEGDTVIIEIYPKEKWPKVKSLEDLDEVDSDEETPAQSESESEAASTIESSDEKSASEISVDSSSEIEESDLNGSNSNVSATAANSEEERRPQGRVVGIQQRREKQFWIGFVYALGAFDAQKGGQKKKKGDSRSSILPRPIDVTAYFLPEDKRAPRFVVHVDKLPPDWVKEFPEYVGRFFEVKFRGWEAHQRYPSGDVLRIMGTAGQIVPETVALLADNGVDTSDFHPELVAGLPDKFVLEESEIAVRRDFRKECIFTIDPLTAKDLDDALHCKKLPNGNFEVGVHIADVSHYVRPGTGLDAVAKSRATSVYLVQKVIPMLPPLLSEIVCSLNPNEPRYAFSVVWEMSPDANIVSTWMGKSIIESVAKLAYEHCQAVLDDRESGEKVLEALMPKSDRGFTVKDIADGCELLQSLAVQMRKRRYDGGALSLGRKKLYFKIDKDFNPVSYDVFLAKDSNKLVEEFMLLANMTVAERIHQAFPNRSLLRRHPPPNPRKMTQFLKFCFDNNIAMDVSSAGHLHASLERLEIDHPDIPCVREIVEDQCTRPMQTALYFSTGDLTENEFHHYALNVPFYTHFTSPIRRLPDIIVHRLLQAALTETQQGIPGREEMTELARKCNEKKLSARKAQDASLNLYLVLTMRDRPVIDTGIVYEVGKNFFRVYVSSMGLTVRVFLDGYKVDVVKRDKVIRVWRKPLTESPDKSIKPPPDAEISMWGSTRVLLAMNKGRPLEVKATLWIPEIDGNTPPTADAPAPVDVNHVIASIPDQDFD